MINFNNACPGFEWRRTDTGEIIRVYYIDNQGKDPGFDRWRVSLYYEPNMAATCFFYSESGVKAFLMKHGSLCYSDYADFRRDWEKEG